MQQTSSSRSHSVDNTRKATGLEARVVELEREIAKIHERNERVTEQKAWEQSFARILWIILLTYLASAGIFYLLEAKHYLLNALVPTLAFLLSIQSLPFLKSRWLRHYRARKAKQIRQASKTSRSA